MTHPSDRLALNVLAIMLAALCGVMWRDCVAGAQDVPAHVLPVRDRDDAARCLVAESAPGPDYLAILSVLSQRASTLGSAARHYCALFVSRHPSRRQLGIRALPGGPLARLYAAHWRSALDAVDAWQRGERPPCAPEHFGDRLTDAARARRSGWRAIDCGHTANAFFVRGETRRVVRAEVARGRHGR